MLNIYCNVSDRDKLEGCVLCYGLFVVLVNEKVMLGWEFVVVCCSIKNGLLLVYV